jgi:DNA-binding response OmpR family regulator
MNSKPPNARIFIAEDERSMRTALADVLTSEGYRVITADNGEAALERILREEPDLILLDVMMPRLDGFSVCAELRRLGIRVPILFLTAKGMVHDRVVGLDSGGDDYLVKPFSTEELLARVRALLRRGERAAPEVTAIRLGRLEIDFAAHRAVRDEAQVHFTAKEFAMLRLLSNAPGEVISREQFLDRVWGHSAFPTTRTVDNHIASIRAKVEPDPAAPRYIQTVHGAGYKLDNLQIDDKPPHQKRQN